MKFVDKGKCRANRRKISGEHKTDALLILRRTSRTHTVDDDIEDVSLVQTVHRNATEGDVGQVIDQFPLQRVGAHAKWQMHQHILAHPLVTGRKTTIGLEQSLQIIQASGRRPPK